jgi:hypothetical protein
MKRLIAVVAGLTLALAGFASSATAPITITGVTEVSRHIKVTFSMPSDWTPNVVSIAKKPDVGSDGSFFSENLVDVGLPKKGDTEFLSSNQLSYGTYYVRIMGYADDFSQVGWSDTASVTISAPPPPPERTDFNICVTTGMLQLGMILFNEDAPCRKTNTLRMKQVIQITSDLITGNMCIRYRTGNRCDMFAMTAIVSTKNVINHRLTVSLRKGGKVMQTKVYLVR